MSDFRISKEDDAGRIVFDLDTQIFIKDDRLSGEDFDRTTWWITRDEDGKAVAYAGARLFHTHDDSTEDEDDKKMIVLVRAGVLPCARGKGLQKKLIAVRTRWGQRQGARAAITYTMPNNYRSSNNLIKCGFRLYNPEEGWVGELGEVLYWWKTLCKR
jgi:GNAT superfamily N-acetyltransferase